MSLCVHASIHTDLSAVLRPNSLVYVTVVQSTFIHVNCLCTEFYYTCVNIVNVHVHVYRIVLLSYAVMCIGCYGIVTLPTGLWFCRKCESQERAARVVS